MTSPSSGATHGAETVRSALVVEPSADPGTTLPGQTSVLDRELAHALFRFVMGVNMFMHGAVRIFGDLRGFVASTADGFADTILPRPLVELYAYGLTFVELAIGITLVLGLWTRASLVIGLLLMSSLVFGMSLRQEWGTVSSQMVYAISFFLLLFWNVRNRFSLDSWLTRRR